jgi:hypothetical protein
MAVLGCIPRFIGVEKTEMFAAEFAAEGGYKRRYIPLLNQH